MTLPVFGYSKLVGMALGHKIAWKAICDVVGQHGRPHALACAAPKNGHTFDSVLYDSPEQFAERLHCDIRVGIEIYNRQMLVVIATHAERALRHFFACLYARQPQLMHELLKDGPHGSGKVDLREVLIATDKDELIRHLAARCASRATEGRKPAILSRLVREADAERQWITKHLEQEIISLIKLRNIVVHDQTPAAPKAEDVTKHFETLTKFFDSLRSIAKANSIPVDEDGRCLLGADEDFYGDLDSDEPNAEIMGP